MLQWGIDTELRSPPRKKQGAQFGRVGTPLPSSPSSPAPGSAKSRGSNVADRFIPRRSGNIPDGFSLFEQRQVTEAADGSGNTGDVDTSPAKQDYRQALRDIILPPVSPADKILPLHQSPTSPGDCGGTLMGSPHSVSPSASARKRRNARLIPKSPDKILDAPDIVDDYYLNLLDWSPSNILAVALGQSVFLWNATTGATHKLVETTGPGNIVTSLTWGSGNILAVGTHSAEVQLWDVAANAPTRCMRGHMSRVASLSWASSSTISSGSRDSLIIHHDVRAEQHKTATLEGHRQEVCGLSWSPTGSQLASGGNDNILNIWEARQNRARQTIERHTAAVKALAWCPFSHNILASGGGTADRKICLWNTSNGTCLNEVDTKSQVCAIEWSVHDKEFVSSHGFTHNQLILWRYYGAGRVQKVTELTGHQARVLHMAKSPDGTTVVSAAADETLRFWRIFGSPTRSAAKLKDEQACRSLLGVNCIR
ncbi:WD40-repeat-containing domain protein [Baffinella frigidus]|nr:WD40-repeat-containing domain protein [Cryptophyta sp. CCMP2293]